MVEITLKKRFEKFTLDINIKSESRRIGILGPSGCGKSMTLRSIAGVEQPDSGRITLDGRVVYDSAEKINLKPQKRRIGYLFQNYALFGTMTVEQNIAAGLKGNREQNRLRVAEMIEKFQLSGLEKRLPGQLSGGQQQRVALARIMAYEPDIILLDEPFSALDANLKDRLQQEMLEMLADYEGVVILVSHSRDEIYRFSEELIIMDDGHMICQGPVREVFADPVYVKAAKLTGCKNIAAMERIDAHTLAVPDWNLQMKVSREIPENAAFLGFRAHDFVPVWEEERPERSIPMSVKSMAQLPFETKYFLNGVAPKVEEICWFVQREQDEVLKEKGMPRWLMLPEEKLLFLK